MSKEALKLALEALSDFDYDKRMEAIIALRLEIDAQNMASEKPVVWGVDRAPAQKRPQNCGTGYCSCIECVMEPAQQEPFGYFQYDIRLDAWVQNRINNKGVAFYVKEQK